MAADHKLPTNNVSQSGRQPVVSDAQRVVHLIQSSFERALYYLTTFALELSQSNMVNRSSCQTETNEPV